LTLEASSTFTKGIIFHAHVYKNVLHMQMIIYIFTEEQCRIKVHADSCTQFP